MKTKNLFLFALLFIGLCTVFSCSKEDIKMEDTIGKSQPVSKVDLDVEITDGLMNFESLQSFLDAMDYLSDNETRFFTDDAFNNWEDQLGFNSLRKSYTTVYNKFEQVEDETSFNTFKSNHRTFINSENEFEFPVKNPILTSLIDAKGKVIINDMLHCFTDQHQIIIVDKDEAKLNAALVSLETDQQAGVFVLDYMQAEENSRWDCGIHWDCVDGNGSSRGKKRVYADMKLYLIAIPVYGGSCQYCYSWDYSVGQLCVMESKIKKTWWKKNHYDDIQWATSFEITTTMGPTIIDGTGWTQNSWQITYSRQLYPLRRANGYPSVSFAYAKKIHFVKNLDVSGVECGNTCL